MGCDERSCLDISGLLTGCVMDRFATNEALDEIYRVLKEGTVFGMVWNIDDCEIVPALNTQHKNPLLLNGGTKTPLCRQ